uniref:Uncharacterized protein n=1 Tax=Siphoviridae sp. ctpoI7 TaxID=2825678 RepID=A0A8S5PAA5_9CAUD|nr:MAG TPA: hypothetical protein [Siphoviridae sp. ctpoI7]
MKQLERLRKINKILAVMLVVTSIEAILVLTQFNNPLSTWETIEFALYLVAMIMGFGTVLKEYTKND